MKKGLIDPGLENPKQMTNLFLFALVCRSVSTREKANWTHAGSTPAKRTNLKVIYV